MPQYHSHFIVALKGEQIMSEMIKVIHYLTVDEIKKLNKSRKETGLSRAEIIRRIIDDHYKKEAQGTSSKESK